MEEGVIWTVSINIWAWAIIYLLCPSNSSEIHCLKGRTGFCSGIVSVSYLDLGKRSGRYLKASLQSKPRIWMWPLLDAYTLIPLVHYLMPVFLQEPTNWWPLFHSFPYSLFFPPQTEYLIESWIRLCPPTAQKHPTASHFILCKIQKPIQILTSMTLHKWIPLILQSTHTHTHFLGSHHNSFTLLQLHRPPPLCHHQTEVVLLLFQYECHLLLLLVWLNLPLQCWAEVQVDILLLLLMFLGKYPIFQR